MGATPYICCKERLNIEKTDYPKKHYEKIDKFQNNIDYIAIFSTSTNCINLHSSPTNLNNTIIKQSVNLDSSKIYDFNSPTLEADSKNITINENFHSKYENDYIYYNQIIQTNFNSPIKNKTKNLDSSDYKDNCISLENIDVLDKLTLKGKDNNSNKITSDSTNNNSISHKKISDINSDFNNEEKNTSFRTTNSVISNSSPTNSISSKRFKRKNSVDLLKANFLKIEDIFIKNPKFKNYKNRGTLILDRYDAIKPSILEIKNSIQTFFNKNNSDGSLMILVASALNDFNSPANILLETNEGERPLFYRDIYNLWINRKSKENNKKLLIIIDSCFSGMWVEENIYNFHFSNFIGINIQASCNNFQASQDTKRAGSNLINFLLYNNLLMKRSEETNSYFRNLCDKEDLIDQNPYSIGFYFDIKKHFNIELGFDSWNDFDIFNKSIEIIKNKDNFIYYIGEVKNNLFHGKGIFHFCNGEYYEGEFKNGKQEGKGILYYSKFSKGEKDNEDLNITKENKIANNKIYNLDTIDNLINENLDENNSNVQEITDISNYYYNSESNLDENSIIVNTNFSIKIEIKFMGFWKNNLFNGKGIYYYLDGERYEGDWINGKKTGIGKLFSCYNKLKYSGQFENDMLHGKGIYFYSNGDIYDGDWNNCKREGKGILYDYHGKLKYKGDFKNNKFHGFGVYYNYFDPKKFSYEGEFNQNKFEGQGKITNSLGDLEYEGHFKNGLFHGFGIFISKEKEKYQGVWIENKRNGKGIIFYSDGTVKYEGDFLNDTFDGKGSYFFQNGKVYIGNFKNNTFSGFGLMLFENKEIYEGNWKNSKREGLGTLYYPNGMTKYRGQFENDKFNGTGKLFVFSEKYDLIYNDNEMFNSNENKDFCIISRKEIKILIKKRAKSLNKNVNFKQKSLLSNIQNNLKKNGDSNKILINNKKLQMKKYYENEDYYNQKDKLFCFYKNVFKRYLKGSQTIDNSIIKGKQNDLNRWNSNFISNDSFNIDNNNFFNSDRETSFMNFEDKLDNKNIIHEFQDKINNYKTNSKTYNIENFVLSEIYYGEFKDDFKEGFGLQYYSNGTKFEGEWKSNQRNGYGTIYFEDKEKFIGEFLDNKIYAGNFVDLDDKEINDKIIINKLIGIIRNS